MQNLMVNEYRHNTIFRNYVDEYCRNNDCTVGDAFNDDQVKRKFWLYTEI